MKDGDMGMRGGKMEIRGGNMETRNVNTETRDGCTAGLRKLSDSMTQPSLATPLGLLPQRSVSH